MIFHRRQPGVSSYENADCLSFVSALQSCDQSVLRILIPLWGYSRKVEQVMCRIPERQPVRHSRVRRNRHPVIQIPNGGDVTLRSKCALSPRYVKHSDLSIPRTIGPMASPPGLGFAHTPPCQVCNHLQTPALAAWCQVTNQHQRSILLIRRPSPRSAKLSRHLCLARADSAIP